MTPRDQEHDNVFHERHKILAKRGYCGFKITGVKKQWDGAEVTAQNASGRTVTGTGETLEEAYRGIIAAIDELLDEPR